MAATEGRPTANGGHGGATLFRPTGGLDATSFDRGGVATSSNRGVGRYSVGAKSWRISETLSVGAVNEWRYRPPFAASGRYSIA